MLPRLLKNPSDRIRARPMDYKTAGVDRDAAESAKQRIARLAKVTFNASVLTEIGSFGGMFRAPLEDYEDPILVSSTDGVGTKIKVAIEADRHDTIGHDIVNHCVNDILVQGAAPLFFLDYIAFGRVDPARVEAVVSGVANACKAHGIPLLGGETAEMPDTYGEDDYDLVGFIVGAVDRKRAITGELIREGDHLVGLPSSGLHTNGYTLARRVLFETLGHSPDTVLPELGGSLREALLEPHRSYFSALEPLIERGKINGLCHITGGGFEGNLSRVLPEGLGIRLQAGAWQVPPIFRAIQTGGIATDEMYRTFNMGIGMIAIVAPENLHDVEHSLERRGEVSYVVGSVTGQAGIVIE